MKNFLLFSLLTLSVPQLSVAQVPTLSFEGKINHQQLHPTDKATVSIDMLPKNFDMFKELYDKVAVEPQGAAALFIVAMTMYKDNPKDGARAIAYTLHHKFAEDPQQIPPKERRFLEQKLLADDSYAQPYAAIAYYQGATPNNNYTANKPYVINFSVKPKQNYQLISRVQAPIIVLQVKTYGNDWNNNPNRQHYIALLKPANKKYYRVYQYRDLLTGVLAPDLTDNN